MSKISEILDVNVCWAHSFGKKRWFEAVVTVPDGEELDRFNVDLPIEDLAKMDVCRTLNSWKKVREWANSEAGHEYIKQHYTRNYWKEAVQG